MSYANGIYSNELLDENAKNAIARIVIALINADGIIDELEVSDQLTPYC